MVDLKPYSRSISIGDFYFSDCERKYLQKVLASHQISYGELCKEFERKFAALHQVKHAFFCNSGTSALQLAIRCLKIEKNWIKTSEVILPGLTFVATLNMVLEEGLTPVLVDVDSKTYNLDPQGLQKAITNQTILILPVHLFGQPCEMDSIMEISRNHGLSVIEDSAETMFAKFNGQSVGSFGEFGCFSTYMAHLLVTGVGGIVTTNDSHYAEIIKSLISHGRDPLFLGSKATPQFFSSLEDIKSRFRFVRGGFSYRITEMEAALGLGQLERMEELLEKRRNNSRYLISQLQDLEEEIQLPTTHPKAEHSFMMFPLVLKNENIDKWELIRFLEDHNIETREMLPLTNQPVYQNKIEFPSLPVSEWINDKGFYIGCHPFLDQVQLDYMVQAIYEYFGSKT